MDTRAALTALESLQDSLIEAARRKQKDPLAQTIGYWRKDAKSRDGDYIVIGAREGGDYIVVWDGNETTVEYEDANDNPVWQIKLGAVDNLRLKTAIMRAKDQQREKAKPKAKPTPVPKRASAKKTASGSGKQTKLGMITRSTTIGEIRKRLLASRAGGSRLRGTEIPGPTRHRYSLFFHLPIESGKVAVSKQSLRATYDEDGNPQYATYAHKELTRPDRLTVAQAIQKAVG